jgi:hypothetical protein
MMEYPEKQQQEEDAHAEELGEGREKAERRLSPEWQTLEGNQI